MLKKASPVLILAVALVGPMALYSGRQWWSKVTRNLSGDPSPEAAGEIAAMSPAASKTRGNRDPIDPSLAPLEGMVVDDLSEVLRFDVTPGWIVDRWPRVSAGLSQLQLQGYRVPLVTGTGQDDLAGALTYYFDPQQQVQRVTFHGTTGDARKLIHLLTTRYGFSRRLTNDPGMFVYEARGLDGQATGFLRIRPAGVVKASHPLWRFEVSLVMERPAPP